MLTKSRPGAYFESFVQSEYGTATDLSAIIRNYPQLSAIIRNYDGVLTYQVGRLLRSHLFFVIKSTLFNRKS